MNWNGAAAAPGADADGLGAGVVDTDGALGGDGSAAAVARNEWESCAPDKDSPFWDDSRETAAAFPPAAAPDPVPAPRGLPPEETDSEHHSSTAAGEAPPVSGDAAAAAAESTPGDQGGAGDDGQQ